MPLDPELYGTDSIALNLGVEVGPKTAEIVELVLCFCYPDIPLSVHLGGGQ